MSKDACAKGALAVFAASNACCANTFAELALSNPVCANVFAELAWSYAEVAYVEFAKPVIAIFDALMIRPFAAKLNDVTEIESP